MAGKAKRDLPSDRKQNRGKIASAYWNYATTRQPFLDRARDCARLTIPTLLPPDAYPATNQRFPTPYQSIGARGVNHLSSKLSVVLFTPPFFRLLVDDEEVRGKMEKDAKTKGQIDGLTASVERQVVSKFEKAALRVPIHFALKHLINGGNALLCVDPKTCKGRTFTLDRYVVRRDPMGHPLEMITMEDIDRDSLPADLKQDAKKVLPSEGGGAPNTEEKSPDPVSGRTPEDTVCVYSRMLLKDGWWIFEQEIDGRPVGSDGRFKKDNCPWLPLRMVAVDGEDYGRGLIEEYYGDLSSLEKLSKAIVQFAAAASKILFLTKPNASTNPRKLAKANSGDFVQGNVDDIGVLQLQKYADFQVAQKTAEAITERLSFAFLMNSAVQRNAERVTAEEIRMMAEELDAGFGGIYAMLSLELQLPIINIIMSNMRRAKELPNIPGMDKVFRPTIITGLAALGRSQDLQNLMEAWAIIGQFPVLVAQVDPQEFATRVFAAKNVEPKGLLKSPEQVQQEQNANRMAEAAGPAGQEAVKAFARHAGAVAAGASPAALSPSPVTAPQAPIGAQ